MIKLYQTVFAFSKLKVFTTQLAKSIENTQNNVAYAYFLPKEWNEKNIKEYFDPEDKLINKGMIQSMKVQIVRDSLDKATGRAIIEMVNEDVLNNFVKKYHEDYIDTKEVLQQIAVKPFSLKTQKNKVDIKRTEKQAYITGLPRKMKNEDLLDLLIDFGEIENIQIPKDSNRDFNKGYAFVLFKKVEDARKFQTFMNGKEFMGKKLGQINNISSVQLKTFRFDSQKPEFKKPSVQEGDIQFEQNKVNYSDFQKLLDVE